MAQDKTKEVIFVGLPGPSHHYGGMAQGNVAATLNAGDISHPREAAMQALSLVVLLRELGQEVAVLPPQLRPCVPVLQRMGYEGTSAEVIRQVAKQDPALLGRVSSSAAMWTANAATVTAAQDSAYGRLQFTPANLVTHFHRSIEAEATWHVLAQIASHCGAQCYAPLPAQPEFADEGAANHMRLAPSHTAAGLNIFVYGRAEGAALPVTYPARQSFAACRHIAAQHGIPAAQALFVQQNPRAIDAGVFHNDVIAVANENLLLVHEQAFAGGAADIARIRAGYEALYRDSPLYGLVIASDELSVEEAVQTYFFNSQLITLPQGGMALVAPQEVQKHPRASALAQRLLEDDKNPISRVLYLDLRQSMKNGGGPACLRLRVPMQQNQIAQLASRTRVLVDDILLGELYGWVRRHYRESLTARDLADPTLYDECVAALGQLGGVLKLSLPES